MAGSAQQYLVGGKPRRRPRCRVRRASNKKLKSAFRYDLERKGTDDYLADLIAEEPDAAAAFAGREAEIARPDDAQWPEWSRYVIRAWNVLRDDRHYGSMGGLGQIYFTAIERYAAAHDIAGREFDEFVRFLQAIDNVYVAHVNEQQRAEAEANKNKR